MQCIAFCTSVIVPLGHFWHWRFSFTKVPSAQDSTHPSVSQQHTRCSTCMQHRRCASKSLVGTGRSSRSQCCSTHCCRTTHIALVDRVMSVRAFHACVVLASYELSTTRFHALEVVFGGFLHKLIASQTRLVLFVGVLTTGTSYARCLVCVGHRHALARLAAVTR